MRRDALEARPDTGQDAGFTTDDLFMAPRMDHPSPRAELRLSSVIKRAAGVAGVLAIAAGVWVWRPATEVKVCGAFYDMILETTAGSHATIEDALGRFGVVPTVAASPKFGATVNDRLPHRREFYIWKEGVVVQSVWLQHFPGGWGVTKISGCSEPGGRFK